MRTRRLCLKVLVCLALAGCTTPSRRARENPAVFSKLSAPDQHLVLHGHVRPGLSADAVKIAWGAPAARYGASGGPASKDAGAREVWIYRLQIVLYAPIGSYEQGPPGVSFGTGLLGGPGFGSGGIGYGGIGYGGWLLNHPRLQFVDGYRRRAVFVRGKLESYEQTYGEFPALP